MSVVMDKNFAEAQAGGAKIVEAGSGRPVLVLAPGFAKSAAHAVLASNFRVVAFEGGGDATARGEAAAAWAEAQGLEKVGVLGAGGDAVAALHAAGALGERAAALVLVSPADVLGKTDDALRRSPVQKLVVLGHDDKGFGKDAINSFRKGLSRTNVIIVYNAGADVAADRPEAFADVVGDFFDRQERFRFFSHSVALTRG